MANELLAPAGAGDGRGGVVRVGAGADHRYVADAADPLEHGAPRRRGRGQVAVAVQGHGADGAEVAGAAKAGVRTGVARVVAQGVRGGISAALCGGTSLGPEFAIPLKLLLRGEVGLRLPAYAGDDTEVVGPGADEQDVRRVLHDPARQGDRVADVLHSGHRAAGQSASVHDRGIHLVGSDGREDGTSAGIEARVVFERHDHVLDHLNTRFAGGQLLGAKGKGSPQGLVVVVRVGRGAIRAAGAAVDGQSPVRCRHRFGLLAVWLIHGLLLSCLGSNSAASAGKRQNRQGCPEIRCRSLKQAQSVRCLRESFAAVCRNRLRHPVMPAPPALRGCPRALAG